MKAAEEAYQEALSIRRELAKANTGGLPSQCRRDAEQPGESLRGHAAEKSSGGSLPGGALHIPRTRESQPGAYLPDVAMTLNNLASLYSDTQRRKAAEEAYQEALSTYRELAKANPEAYLPNVATTLNNLASLYSATQRRKAAEEAYQEALLHPPGTREGQPGGLPSQCRHDAEQHWRVFTATRSG